eukprot:snap_masked-scaffold_15-processed-gene-10.10-mRNA-1 protein AED:0.06 eAED:0.06 QI:0/-1/0/1/-1/1/1/0/633
MEEGCFQGRFLGTERWNSKYQRNHRKCGGKHLRCFPYCKPVHKSTTFCGHSLKFELSYRKNKLAEFEEGAKFVMIAEFTPVEPSEEFKKLNKCQSDIYSNRVKVGDKLTEDIIHSKVAARRESVIWYQHNIYNDEPVSADMPKKTSFFDLTSFEALNGVESCVFEFNKEQRAWHYGFVGSKSIKNVQHCVRVLLFKKNDEDLVCIGTFKSPCFKLYGRKSRSRARKARQAKEDLYKVEPIGFQDQLKYVGNNFQHRLNPETQSSLTPLAGSFYECEEDRERRKRFRRDSVTHALDKLSTTQNNDISNFMYGNQLQFLNFQPAMQMPNFFKLSDSYVPDICKSLEKFGPITSSSIRKLFKLKGDCDAKMCANLLFASSSTVEQILDSVSSATPSLLHMVFETFAQSLESLLANVADTGNDNEVVQTSYNDFVSLAAIDAEMRNLSSPGFTLIGYSHEQMLTENFSGKWSRNNFSVSSVVGVNKFSTLLDYKLQSFEIKFDAWGIESYLYLREKSSLFDMFPKKFLISDTINVYPENKRSVFKSGLEPRYYRCLMNNDLGHLVICTYYEKYKVLNIMRLKNSAEIEEVFVIFARRTESTQNGDCQLCTDEQSGLAVNQEHCWKEIGRLTNTAYRL